MTLTKMTASDSVLWLLSPVNHIPETGQWKKIKKKLPGHS